MSLKILHSTGLNDLEKKLAKSIKPKVKIWVEPDGETIVHKFNVGILKDTIKCKLGEELEREYLGHKGKVSIFSRLLLNEPMREKTNNLGFRPGPTQTDLYSHRSRLED